MSIKSPALLAALRARLWTGDTVAAAARACGVSQHVARGLLYRHGRGTPPPAPPPLPAMHCPHDGGCMWPTSDCRPWVFCSARRLPGRSYCPEHARRAFVHGDRPGRPFVLQQWTPA